MIESRGSDCVSSWADLSLSTSYSTFVRLAYAAIRRLIAVVALWLGHGSPVTTHRYVEVGLRIDDRALVSLQAQSRSRLEIDPRMIYFAPAAL
jgi:hypothetical protein